MRVKGLNKMPGIQWVLGKYLFPSVYENHFKKMAYCGESYNQSGHKSKVRSPPKPITQ